MCVCCMGWDRPLKDSESVCRWYKHRQTQWTLQFGDDLYSATNGVFVQSAAHSVVFLVRSVKLAFYGFVVKKEEVSHLFPSGVPSLLSCMQFTSVIKGVGAVIPTIGRFVGRSKNRLVLTEDKKYYYDRATKYYDIICAMSYELQRTIRYTMGSVRDDWHQ